MLPSLLPSELQSEPTGQGLHTSQSLGASTRLPSISDPRTLQAARPSHLGSQKYPVGSILVMPLQIQSSRLVEFSGDHEFAGHGLHAPEEIWSNSSLYVPTSQATRRPTLHPANVGERRQINREREGERVFEGKGRTVSLGAVDLSLLSDRSDDDSPALKERHRGVETRHVEAAKALDPLP